MGITSMVDLVEDSIFKPFLPKDFGLYTYQEAQSSGFCFNILYRGSVVRRGRIPMHYLLSLPGHKLAEVIAFRVKEALEPILQDLSPMFKTWDADGRETDYPIDA